VGQGVVRLRVRGLAEAAACLACVEVPAPASAWTEPRSGAGGHWAAWARGGAPPLVGDDVDPHPHVREALCREQCLEIGHSVHLRLGLPPDLHEELHLVLLAASSSPS